VFPVGLEHLLEIFGVLSGSPGWYPIILPFQVAIYPQILKLMIVRAGLEIEAIEGTHSIISQLEHARVHSKVLCGLDCVWAMGCLWEKIA